MNWKPRTFSDILRERDVIKKERENNSYSENTEKTEFLEILELFLPESFKGLSKSYIIKMALDDSIQDNWMPKVGDVIVGPTGNIFVIASEHYLIDKLGGIVFFFGGGFCCNDDTGVMNSTYSFTMNRSGDYFTYDSLGNIIKIENLNHSSWKKFKFIPYPHELINL